MITVEVTVNDRRLALRLDAVDVGTAAEGAFRVSYRNLSPQGFPKLGSFLHTGWDRSQPLALLVAELCEVIAAELES